MKQTEENNKVMEKEMQLYNLSLQFDEFKN